MKLREAIRRPRARRVLVVAGALLVLWTIAGFLVAPAVLRPVVERKLAESLHRPVSVRGLALNPFALSATLEGLLVKERAGSGAFFSLERAYVNLEAISLLRRAPVIREITLTKPSIHVVRNDDGAYNFQDLLDEASKPKPASAPVRFSLNNIRVEEGSADFDDRLKRVRHTLRNVTLGIPFLSNIPSQVEITTRPAFEAKINGAPFSVHGKTKPFSATRETTVDLDLTDVDLPYYAAYLPGTTPAKLTAGRLDLKLTLSFLQPPSKAPALVLSGRSSVRWLAVEAAGRPLLAWERLDAVVNSFDVFGGKLRVASLQAIAPEVWIRREKSGDLNLPSAFVAAPARGERTKASASHPPEAPKRPMRFELALATIERGAIHYDDFALDASFHAAVADVALSLGGYSNAPGRRAVLEVSAKTDAGETLKNAGTVSADPFAMEGTLEIARLPLKRYRPFFDRLVTFEVEDGVLDLGSRYLFSTGGAGKNASTVLSALTATLRSPRFRKREDRTPFFQAPSVELTSSALDFGRRDAALGALSSAGGTLAVVRNKDGNADLTNLLAPPRPGAPEPPSPPWTVALHRLSLGGYTIRIDDRAAGRPARYALTKTDLTLEDFSTAAGKKANLSVRFGINGRGTASASGPVGIHPTYADLKADVKRLDLVPLEAYVLSNLRVSLARGSLTANGRLELLEDRGGKAGIVFAGKALVADLLAVDPETKLDVFQWEAFSLEGAKAGYNPTFLHVAKLSLTGAACDIVIDPDGTVNLSRIAGKSPPAAEDDDEAAGPFSETAVPVAAAPPATPSAAPAPAAAPTGPPPEDKVPIRIDTLIVEKARIGLVDHFIRPSYAATLTDLAGRVTGLSTDAGTVAQLDLRGKLANRSPLEISGRVNPLAASAFADVKGTFRDIDLPVLTPYSGKYAGYTIARGTLTVELQYKLQNRKLSAENRLLVDQFELGDKVESKDATKLPVRLAVSLLKDKDGLIDLDLPVEGSLDDPKFRLGKVIWHVLGNLIGKAATAPFALLGKLLGGKSEELSSIDFADGRAALDDAAKQKLDALAKALNGRPALKLEAAGRFSSEQDSDGLLRLLLERKVRAQKLLDLARKGDSPARVDAVVVDEKEYPTYLEKAYRKEKFQKPRNVLGIAKDIPAPEMESLMRENLKVTADDLRQLALARANAVKEDLTVRGGVDPSRIFIVEPGEKSAEPLAKARASRVDFALK
ncbi:MAG: DUF748 domain-containing protein [Acidobacteriota bacterium]